MTIAERLRRALTDKLKDAYAQTERLRERVAELQAECGYKDSIHALEVERLRAALEQAVDDQKTAQR